MTTFIVRARECRFVVPGQAVSFRSPRAATYKARVRRYARPSFRGGPFHDSVEVRLDYFHCLTRRFDMDNVAKCVLDALNGLAYADDQQAKLQAARAHDLRSRVTLQREPVDLVKPMAKHDTYLFVRVRAVV